MGDDPGGNLNTPIAGRRVTRQSTRRVSAVDSEKENPYRKPTYQPAAHGNGESSNDSSRSGTSSSNTPGTSGRGGRNRGRQSTTPAVPEVKTPAPTPKSGRGRGGGRGGASARGSATKRPAARPECIASSGRKKKKKRKNYYNPSDYHYGSDFEEEEDEDLPEDEDEEELEEEPPSPSVSSLEDDLDMDLDDSSSTSGLPLTSAPEPIYVPPAAPTENLNLPKSSEDLLIDKDLVIRALAVYEPLRRFSNLIRLTQFRFEEFCGALSSTDEQNVLLVEIHIQLLKALLREDDLQSTTFGPPELKDSIQSIFYFIDAATWPEPLRMLLESDPSFEAPEIPADYPFVSVEKRLDILTTLVNQFLATTPVRDSLSSEVIKHEDHCRSCVRLGELICCETCPAVYHLECIELAHKKDWDAGNPPDQWKCGICKKDELTGTADCISELESAGLLIRQEKLGYDRHGRKYWFMARRIIVESETECWYYTTRKQLGELLYCLQGESYEKTLLNAIRYNKEEIERQMEVTEELTQVGAQHRRTWLEIEDLAIDKLNEERAAIIDQEKEEKEREIREEAERLAKIEEEKTRAEEDKRRKEEEERRRVREERLAKRNEEKARMMEEGELQAINDLIREQEAAEAAEREREAAEAEAAQKKADEEAAQAQKEKEDKEKEAAEKAESKLGENGEENKTKDGEETKSPKKDGTETETESESPMRKPTTKSTLDILIAQESERTTRLKSHPPFKLGQPPITYVNSYSSDPLALSKQQHQEERDRKRYTSHKFSLTTASDFKWFGTVTGNRDQLQQALRATLLTLEAMLPTTLLHVNWSALRRSWMTNKDFKRMMLELVDCLRGCLFNPVWFDQAGHLYLKRTSMMERDRKKNMEKFEKKRADDEEERFRYMGRINYTLPIKHQVFKQKGEEYRIHGQYGWIWRSAIRPKLPASNGNGNGINPKPIPLSSGPQKHVIQVKGDDGVVKTMLIEPSVYNKLMAKRVPGEPPGIRYDRVRLGDGRVVAWGRHTRAKVENVEKIVEEVVENLLETIEAEVEDSDVKVKPSTEGLGSLRPPSSAPIDVSRGLVLANRVQFPKIAHGAPVCDGLIGRRLRAGAAEEKELLRKYGATTVRACYSYSCQTRTGIQTGGCYSPSCTHLKVTQAKQLREEKHYTTGDTSKKIQLKKAFPGVPKPANTLTKPVRTSPAFATQHGRSIFVPARWELRKLARSGGRTWTPPGFNSVKTWSPYPCGRPNFKTAWFWRTITGRGLGAMALQLRILWACIRWDDLQAKPPLEGRSQVTTDTDIITYEILGHRIVGRFMERVQYLRKKHIMPIDGTPSMKTIVVKDTSPNTPTSSRLGLRKRKRLAEPASPNPSVLEEWVDEDKLELWEIRYYGERKQTRAKSGLTPTRPEKYDPSPVNTPPKEATPGGSKRIADHAAVAEMLDNKVQHISKRNHAKDVKTNEAKETTTAPKEPTASELLQQSIAARAFCTPEAAKAAAKSVGGRKFFVSKAKETLKAQQAAASPAAASPGAPTHMTNINLTSATTGQTTRLTVFKGEDGRLQIKGLLPGQHCYQTADGRLHIVGSPHPQPGGPSRLVLPEQQKAVPVPLITSAAPSTPTASPPPRPATPQTAQVPRLVSIASAGTQPRVVAVSATAPPVPRLVSVAGTGGVPALRQVVPQQQRILVTTPAGQQQIILTGGHSGQQFVIRQTIPTSLTQPQGQLPISIVSPSKQQTVLTSQAAQPQQQQQFKIVMAQDGTQYLQRITTASPAPIPAPATASSPAPTMAGTVRLVTRSVRLPNGQTQMVQVQVNDGTPTRPVVAPAAGSAVAVKSSPGVPSASTMAVPQPATPSLQRPPLAIRLPAGPPSSPSPPALVAIAQQQQRPGILRRFQRPITAAQITELQARGLIRMGPPTSAGATVLVGNAPSSPLTTLAAAKVDAGSPPKPVIPVRMSTPPPVIIGLEKPITTDVNKQSPVVATKSAPQTPVTKSPTKEAIPLPPPPAIIGLDVKMASTIVAPATGTSIPAAAILPKSEPLKTPPKIELPPMPPPPEISLPPPSAVTASTPAALPAKKVSRRKAVHIPYVEMKPPGTPPTSILAHRPKEDGMFTQSDREALFQQKENLKDDIMKKRALLEANLLAQIQAEKEALKPVTPPKAEQAKYTCSCGRPITSAQFYVSCAGGCTSFFHGVCVGLTRQDLNQGKVYTCSDCKDGDGLEMDEDGDVGAELEIETAPPPAKRGRGRKKGWRGSGGSNKGRASTSSTNANANTSSGGDRSLYCVCKQPYDDSHFYIGCDNCDDWFHGRCVGVLPNEGSSIPDYKCPSCAPDSPFNHANFKPLTSSDQESLRSFMRQVLEHDDADDFYEAVDHIEHPNYRRIIREPMELKTMEQRVVTHRYKKLADFVADACRIFDNCRHYNQANSSICKKANNLENVFSSKLRILRERLLAG